MLAALHAGARFATTQFHIVLGAGSIALLCVAACQPQGGSAEGDLSTGNESGPVESSSLGGEVTSTASTGAGEASGPGPGSTGSDTVGPGCVERTHQGHATLADPQSASELAGITTITGDLSIETNAPELLSALGCLQQLGGSLRLNATAGGSTDLNPDALLHLNRLTSLGGDLEILGQTRLARLHGLEALTSIGGDLLLADSPGVRTLDGLAGLQRVGGRVRLANLAHLRALDGLAQLGEVGELDLRHLPQVNSLTALAQLRLCPELILLDLPQLATLSGLEGLTALQRLQLHQLPRLNELKGLRGVKTIAGAIELSQLDVLVDLRGLESLTRLGELRIVALPQLASLEGVEQPLGTSLTRVELADNAGLSTLADSPIWQGFSGHLRLIGNTQLAALTGLRALTHLESFVMEGPDQVVDLTPLSQLGEVAGLLRIANHPQLRSLAGLGSLRRVAELELIGPMALAGLNELSPELAVGKATRLIELADLLDFTWLARSPELAGTLELAGLASLTDLSVLAPLRTITGRLALRSLPQITAIDAWPALEQLGGLTIANNPNLQRMSLPPGLGQLGTEGLCIHGNAQLEHVQGEGQLETIAGALSLTQNPKLATLVGLSGLSSVGSALWIEGNDELRQLSALGQLRSTGARVWSLGETCVGLPRNAAKPRDGYVGIEIRRMATLESLAGLDAIDSTMGSLYLKENPQLDHVEALAGLQVVGPSVHILNNPSLTREDATSLAESLDFTGFDLQIDGNGHR